jgi:hypothetical protein
MQLTGSAQTQQLAQIAAARNMVLDGSQKLTAAQNKYNFIVGELNRLPGVNAPNQLSFNGLSGMGVLPAAVVTAAIVGGTIAVACTALAVLANQVGGAIHGGDGYIAQISSALRSSGVAVSAVGESSFKIGTIAIIGLAAVAGFMFLKKRGSI